MSIGALLERRRVAVTWVFAALFFFFAAPSPRSVAAGLVLMTAGAVVRTWASGHIRKQERLATAGPYAYSRNPLYVGSFLIAAGALVMGRNPWLAVLFALGAVPLYTAVMRREERFLAEKFSAEFNAYRQAVPLFFPRMTPYPGRRGRFEWGLVRRHREWQVWTGAAGVTLLLLIRYYWL